MGEKEHRDSHQEAAGKLTEPGEAPPPASQAGQPLLNLQRAIGNRAVGRLLRGGDSSGAQPGAVRPLPAGEATVQLSPLPPGAVRDVDLGAAVIIATEGTIPMVATSEVVQAGDRAGQFRGFTTYHEALSLSLLQPGFTAIVRDPGGQYHVLDVAESAPVEDAVRSQPRRGLAAFTVVRFVNPLIPTPAAVIHGEMPLRQEDTWQGRVERAQQMRRRYFFQNELELGDEMTRAFRDLAADAFSVAPGEINVLFRASEQAPPGQINVMLDPHVEAGGVSGIGQRELPPGQANPPVGLRPSEPAGEQRPFLWISADAFVPSGPDRARAVMRHESSHAGTTERVRTLMEIWQGQGEPEGDFWMWLRGQQRQRGGGPHQVTVADLQIAMARLYRQSDEPLACVARFTAEYHQVPPDQIDEETFGELRYMLANWVSAGEGMPGAGVPPLRGEAMRRLRVYYQEQLDDAHRAPFDRWVDSLPAGSDERILFPHDPSRGYAQWSADSVQAAIGEMRSFRRGVRRRRR